MKKDTIENLTFYNADNLEIMRWMDDNEFDLAIVDPPYGIGVNINIGRRKGNKKSDYHKFAGGDISIPVREYFDELKRISKNQIIWGGNYMVNFLHPSPCWIVWDKGFSEKVTFAQVELAWTSFSSSAKKFNFNAAANNNRIHPTEKPIALYDWILKNYAKPGDKILDTHLGSGSIAIAIEKANRINGMGLQLTGIELDEDYYNAALQRFKIFAMQQTIMW